MEAEKKIFIRRIIKGKGTGPGEGDYPKGGKKNSNNKEQGGASLLASKGEGGRELTMDTQPNATKNCAKEKGECQKVEDQQVGKKE